MKRRAVFLDRDGVLNNLIPDPRTGLPESPLRPEDVTLMDDAAEALSALRAAGFALVGVSNQPAAAKGVASLDELRSVQAQVVELFARSGVTFDRFSFCFHHPEGSVPTLARACECRKPAPGMLKEAIRELTLDPDASWMVGDTDTDIEAGQAAGVRAILIANPASAHKRVATAIVTTAPNLAAAAEIILRDSR